MNNTVNTERLYDTFRELVSIDSESFHERTMADCLTDKLKKLGCTVQEDEAGAAIGGNAGNLFARLPGTGDPVLFAAHMDTVSPGKGKQALLNDNGRITSAGDTILGADDLAAVSCILEALKEILEEGKAHRPIEILFTAAEEAYIQGVSHFDTGCIQAKTGYIPDLSADAGSYSAQEPTLIRFFFTVKGRASHAGFAPEKGISAIAAVSFAVSTLHIGWQDDHTSMNIGTVHGGEATNVIAEYCTAEGEIRSSVHEDALQCMETVREAFRKAAEAYGASLTEDMHIYLKNYRVEADDPALQEYTEVLQSLGIPVHAVPSNGGSDANYLRRMGFSVLCIANAMHEIHSTGEYTTLQEMAEETEILRSLMCHKAE